MQRYRTIVAGAVITGRVTSVREFGAFVDLGAGVQGLLHVSEMAWSRVSNPAEMVKAGDEITVKVLRVDEEKQKISLGLKQLSADPWSRVPEVYKVGQRLPGRVTRVAQFGAFGIALSFVTFFTGMAFVIVIGAVIGPVLAEADAPVGRWLRGRAATPLPC